MAGPRKHQAPLRRCGRCAQPSAVPVARSVTTGNNLAALYTETGYRCAGCNRSFIVTSWSGYLFYAIASAVFGAFFVGIAMQLHRHSVRDGMIILAVIGVMTAMCVVTLARRIWSDVANPIVPPA